MNNQTQTLPAIAINLLPAIIPSSLPAVQAQRSVALPPAPVALLPVEGALPPELFVPTLQYISYCHNRNYGLTMGELKAMGFNRAETYEDMYRLSLKGRERRTRDGS